MIKTRIEEIKELNQTINNLYSCFEYVYLDLKLKKPWHKVSCLVRGCGADELGCECGFSLFENAFKSIDLEQQRLKSTPPDAGPTSGEHQ